MISNKAGLYQRRPPEEVYIRSLDDSVNFKRLSGAQYQTFEKMIHTRTKQNGNSEDLDAEDLAHIRQWLIKRTACDEGGGLLFDPEDTEDLAEHMDADVMNELFDAANRVCKLLDFGLGRQEKKDSPPIRPDDSGSDSPENGAAQ